MAMIYGMTERLTEAVKKSGLSLDMISERVGISKKRLYALLSGDSGGCYASTFAKLCATLKVSADWMYGLRKGNYDDNRL